MTYFMVSLLHRIETHHLASATVQQLASAVRTDWRDKARWLALADAAEECGVYLGCFRFYIDDYFA